ncbi:MAG: hypothetical protein VB084_06165 [Syntrophomonadaceae bacterium]|nr:hypothetical protein [Syntrophomonadaceae bacterium]
MSEVLKFLKRFIPPSSNTVNSRLDYIEQLIGRIDYAGNPIPVNHAINAEALYYSCWSNLIRDTHKESFGPFKGANKGCEVVIVGTGPTLNYYNPIEKVVHIGINSSYKKENLKLDYLFLQDFAAGRIYDVEEIRSLTCIKFFGKHCSKPNFYTMADIPEHVIEEMEARKYFVNHIYGPAGNTPIMVDLEYFPVMDCWTTAFSALEFAFYTHPQTIYFVGLDTSVKLGGHYDDSSILVKAQAQRFAESVKGYKKVKQFADSNYPDIKIVSVNPVGLKGIFEDIYTESFLDAYPEIRKELAILNQ